MPLFGWWITLGIALAGTERASEQDAENSRQSLLCQRKAEPRPEGSAKDAARTSKRIRNWPAPHSVLRKFFGSATTSALVLAFVVALPAGRGSARRALLATNGPRDDASRPVLCSIPLFSRATPVRPS